MNILQIVETADGSKTIFNPHIGEHYHSHNGALQESQHVFVNAGLMFFLEKQNTKQVSICEVGFGTGLNFLLTADYCNEQYIQLKYTGIEAFPLKEELIFNTGYEQFVTAGIWQNFQKTYLPGLQTAQHFSENCILKVEPVKMLDFQSGEKFDIIYFDAFAVKYQPEMWNNESLAHITQFLKPGGIFVTYAITGNLKRSLKLLGFEIQKIPGAAGKREMLRAVKT